MKVQPPRDGRTGERTDAGRMGTGKNARTEGKAGRIIWVSAKSSKNGKAVVHNHSHPLWTICHRASHLQLQRIWKMEGVQTNFGKLLDTEGGKV